MSKSTKERQGQWLGEILEGLRQEADERDRRFQETYRLFEETQRQLVAEHPLYRSLTMLGLSSWPCSRKQVRAAYRSKAWEYHPDSGGNQEEFLRLTEARD